MWLGLKSDIVHKHIPKIIHTSKGHIPQEQKNLCSTKKTIHTQWHLHKNLKLLAPEPILPISKLLIQAVKVFLTKQADYS